MKFPTWKIKAISSAAMIILIGIGRWYNLSVIHEQPFDMSVLAGIYYGLFAGMIGFFVVDLVLARGLLQNKIFSLKILSVLLFASIVAEKKLIGYLGINLLHFYAAMIVISSIFFISILLRDMNQKGIAVFSCSDKIPQKYFQKRPVKTAFELLFRLFPNPEPVGLYRIGEPKGDSPVFVTGNFELTIRRVVKALKSTDCWLLVCDSRGINIWCSAESEKFGTESIIDSIKLTKLSEKVDSGKIILPQLVASNISTEKIKAETGFDSEFGPLNIKNIEAYFKDRNEKSIREVTFTLPERVEVSLGSPIILAALLVIVCNFIGYSHLAVILPTIYLFSVVHAIIFPKRIVKRVLIWAPIWGAIVFVVNYLLFSRLLNTDFLLDNIIISVGLAYLAIEFEGWSPLVKFQYVIYEKAEISIDKELCIGCRTCTHVCPKSVFEIRDGKSEVVDAEACVLCKACFKQCPVNAVIHSMDD